MSLAGRTVDAVVLAGGAASRLGGASKPDVVVGGRPLLDRVLDATAGARDVVVVGPPALARPGVRTVLEHPPGGGPVAGIEAGLSALTPADDDALVLVLACDVPRAARAVPALLAALDRAPDADGAQVVDAGGHPQLVALLRRGPLRARLDALVAEGGVHGVAVRRMLDGMRTADVPDDGAAQDADTWADVRRLDAELDSGLGTGLDGEPDEPTAPPGAPTPEVTR